MSSVLQILWRLVKYKSGGGRIQTTTAGRMGMKWISPWFGIAAMGNVIVFTVLGILIPWLLTNGLETPAVQSKTWDGCLRNDGSNDLNGKWENEAYIAADKYTRCWFNTSGILDSCPRQDSLLLERPNLEVSHNVSCPFGDTACHPDAQPLQLDHVNLTLRDYGVNLHSGVRHSRRLTCSPLRLDHFITIDSDGEPWLLFARVDDSSIGKGNNSPSLRRPISWVEDFGALTEAGLNPLFRLRLSSPDGQMPQPTDPNWYYGHENTAPDVQTWSRLSGPQLKELSWTRTLHPDLDQLNGDTFVVAFKAGRVRYFQPISDPMYSAHFKHGGHYYLPDYEYTAIGCVEQHQLCLSGLSVDQTYCTPYSSLTAAMWLIDHDTTETDEKIVVDINTFEKLLWGVNTGAFVDKRGIAALLPGQPNIWNWLNVQVDPDVQWMLDVRAWFESSFLLFRVYSFALITGDRVGGSFDSMNADARDRLCGHVLFLDGDYTDINLLGLVVSLLAIGVVVVTSHWVYLRNWVKWYVGIIAGWVAVMALPMRTTSLVDFSRMKFLSRILPTRTVNGETSSNEWRLEGRIQGAAA